MRRPWTVALNVGALTLAGQAGPDPSASAAAEPTTLAAASHLAFSGYSWTVKTSDSPVGPGPNVFTDDPGSLWVDERGHLHLRVRRIDGIWRSVELIGPPLGYGTYMWTTRGDLTQLADNLVLGMFTWSDDPVEANRELDIEVSQWGQALDRPRLYWVVRPGDDRDRALRMRQQPVEAGTLQHTLVWEPGSVTFSIGGTTGTRTWQYAQPDVPAAGDAAVRINLWLHGSTVPGQGDTEVVISEFRYRPAGAEAPHPKKQGQGKRARGRDR